MNYEGKPVTASHYIRYSSKRCYVSLQGLMATSTHAPPQRQPPLLTTTATSEAHNPCHHCTDTSMQQSIYGLGYLQFVAVLIQLRSRFPLLCTAVSANTPHKGDYLVANSLVTQSSKCRQTVYQSPLNMASEGHYVIRALQRRQLVNSEDASVYIPRLKYKTLRNQHKYQATE